MLSWVILPPNIVSERILGVDMRPLGDRGREPGGVVAAKSVEAEVLVLYGRLDKEEDEGDCRSILSVVRGSLADEELAARGGDCPKGAASFIDVMKSDRSR